MAILRETHTVAYMFVFESESRHPNTFNTPETFGHDVLFIQRNKCNT